MPMVSEHCRSTAAVPGQGVLRSTYKLCQFEQQQLTVLMLKRAVIPDVTQLPVTKAPLILVSTKPVESILISKLFLLFGS